MYLDAFTWLLREESEEGQQKNKTDDLRAMSKCPELADAKKTMLEEHRRIVAKHKKFAETNPEGGKTRNLLAVD